MGNKGEKIREFEESVAPFFNEKSVYVLKVIGKKMHWILSALVFIINIVFIFSIFSYLYNNPAEIVFWLVIHRERSNRFVSLVHIN